MDELAQGTASWLHPTWPASRPSSMPCCPIGWAPGRCDWPRRGSRLTSRHASPSSLLLALTLLATWYGVYLLARSPRAQPVAFAFGGEAKPKDYARAMADGGLLALIACLGLAQLSHETTPALAQVCLHRAELFRGGGAALGACWLRPSQPRRLAGLALSGAASWPCCSARARWSSAASTARAPGNAGAPRWRCRSASCWRSGGHGWPARWLDLWRWRIDVAGCPGRRHRSGQLLLWFTWPAWPLVLWTLWRWRRQLVNRP